MPRIRETGLSVFLPKVATFHLLMLECEIRISPVISLRFKIHLVLWLPRITRWTL